MSCPGIGTPRGAPHSRGSRADAYRQDRSRTRHRLRLRDVSVWLAPGGAYVLGHFRSAAPARLAPVGPRPVPPARIRALFVPPLVERARDAETHCAEFPIGPTVRVALYWFEKEPMNTGHSGASGVRSLV